MRQEQCQADRLQEGVSCICELHAAFTWVQTLHNQCLDSREVGEPGSPAQLFEKLSPPKCCNRDGKSVKSCYQNWKDLWTSMSDAYLNAAFMQFLGMTTATDVPTSFDFSGVMTWPRLRAVAQEFFSTFVWPDPAGNDRLPLPVDSRKPGLVCPLCHNTYVSSSVSVFREHLISCTAKVTDKKVNFPKANAANKPEQRQAAEKYLATQDFKWNQLSNVLRYCYIWRGKALAVKMGDGHRMLTFLQMEIVDHKIDNHSNYAPSTLDKVLDIKVAASARVAFDLLHNSTINIRGGEENNCPHDEGVEQSVKVCKGCSRRLGGNHSPEALQQAVRLIEPLKAVTTSVLGSLDVGPRKGNHDRKEDIVRVQRLVKIIADEELFKYTPGRRFLAHPLIPRRIDTTWISRKDLNRWVEMRISSLALRQETNASLAPTTLFARVSHDQIKCVLAVMLRARVLQAAPSLRFTLDDVSAHFETARLDNLKQIFRLMPRQSGDQVMAEIQRILALANPAFTQSGPATTISVPRARLP